MNRLADATSLYLQQHADNPVEWEPWDEQALQRARDERRPILLSIGYSACHWCHVMAHESFENAETARWMNALFVNVKVDREERPDLDRIYQLSHQLLTGRGGGWPLTVFLDPDSLTPFFAGTYFPPEPRHGLPGFPELLKKVREWFDTRRDDIDHQNERLQQAIGEMQSTPAADGPPGATLFDSLPSQFERNYDAQNGGFGGAPKFPQAPLLNGVRTAARRTPESAEADDMLHDALTRMALSGLRDHLDGGFFRYCVDDTWTIPHFEKMLYDNAMLLPLYAETAARRNDPFLVGVAEGIVSWLASEMRHEDGGFSASIDADADGEEGGFHIWQPGEIDALLDPEAAATIKDLFGLNGPPNFEGRAWHLVRHGGDTHAEIPEAAIARLREARSRRVPPATDRKQITAWNALCIDGLARAGRFLDRPNWIEMAASAMDAVRSHCWTEGRLYTVWAGGRARFPAYLDDHAGMLVASLSLMQARWRKQDFAFACALADLLLECFMDKENGGFFFTAEGAEAPIQRLRPWQDDALPAGNGVAALGLLQLGHLCGDNRYLDAAHGTLAASRSHVEQFPLAHAGLIRALDEYVDPPTQVIISGGDVAAQTELRTAAAGSHRLHCYAIGPGEGSLPGVTGRSEPSRSAQAFVCRGVQCLPPTSDPTELARLLQENG